MRVTVILLDHIVRVNGNPVKPVVAVNNIIGVIAEEPGMPGFIAGCATNTPNEYVTAAVGKVSGRILANLNLPGTFQIPKKGIGITYIRICREHARIFQCSIHRRDTVIRIGRQPARH